ncbi:hypothetical protein EC991_008529 [Linnemannia zychae]|nr:hypothetical protein EC991_008529 [Linnemannia zychae]
MDIHRYVEMFVNDKEKEINQRRGDMDYISGYDLFIKPVLRLKARHPTDRHLSQMAHAEDLQQQHSVISLLDGMLDLYACTLVSRDWHNILNPILWGDVESYCEPKDSEEKSPFICSVVATRPLKKYGNHIQTLKIECLDKDLQQLITVAPNRFLRLHSIELIGVEFSDDAIANLLGRCSRQCHGMGLQRVVFNPDDDSYWGFHENEFNFGKRSIEALKE